MAPAVYDQTQVEIEGGEYVFRATGSVLAFDGFYKVWERDEKEEPDLPQLAEGEDLDYHGLKPEQHFTPAAAALLGGDAHQGARAARHRPPVDVRADRRDDHQGPRLRRDQGAPAAPDPDR